MADTTTPILGLIKPEVGASRNEWGKKSNQNWSTVDDVFKADAAGVGVGLHIGADKVLRIDGAMEGPGAPVVIIPRGHIDGFILFNATGDAANDIIIGSGEATSDDGDYLLKLEDPIIKRLDGAWAVGTGQGGLSSGSKAEDTWYHVFAVARIDTLVTDVLFSLTLTPNMPLGYTKKRRIGSIYNAAGGTGGIIRKFDQLGNWFAWDQPIVDLSDSAPGTDLANRALSVPADVRVLADISPFHRQGDDPSITTFQATHVDDEIPQDAEAADLIHPGTVGPSLAHTWQVAGRMLIRTSLFGKINTRARDAASKTGIVTHGWYDFRGRDA